MKFLVVCLFAILGAAVAMPVEGDTVKEPVPLIVSDYSTVAKDNAVPEPVAPVVPEAPVEDVAKNEPVESTDAPVTEPSADEAEKEFANEVKQEEKLLRTTDDDTPAEEVPAVTEGAAASDVDEVRKEVVESKEEPAEDAPVTTEAVSFSEEVREAEPVQSDALTVEEEARSEDVGTTVQPSADDVAEFVPAKDPASRRRRDAEEETTDEATTAEESTEESAEPAKSAEAEVEVESRTEPEEVTTVAAPAESS